ncbi:MAG: error-prone DNA polymerase [Rhodobacteraceae bacterium]|nr:error-prone DNA polymerase [Paracoccaceae bacterium]
MFCELAITSNFTFLRGASHPEELARTAARLKLPAFAIADENSVAGIVRAHAELREVKRKFEGGEGSEASGYLCVPRLLPAARLTTASGFSVVALPHDRDAWGRLTRLLSIGRLRAAKGSCELHIDDLEAWLDGMDLLVEPPAAFGSDAVSEWRHRLDRLSGQALRAGLLMSPRYNGADRDRFAALSELAGQARLPLVATASPLMHRSDRVCLADVLTAIHSGCTVAALGTRAQANAERRLRSHAEMQRLFRGYEQAVLHTRDIARRCRFSLDELRYEYPLELAANETPQQRLERLSEEGLRHRYPGGVPSRVDRMYRRELRIIDKLDFAPYFLTVHDIVEFARSRNILCQGRGSAANSVVCYALGVTSVSPEVGTMVFERFVSEARNEPPDIDVDFEHERREEVIQHIYEKYGRHRAGLCATVVHYRGKRAIREVGKAMGLSEDVVAALSSQLWGWGGGVSDRRLGEIGLDHTDAKLRRVLRLCEEIRGFPRHLSQHTGGFVITEGRLDELVPIENASMEDRTVICWDKDDIDALGILKVDILGLGMLTCIRKAFALIRTHHLRQYTLDSIPREDPAVYDLLCRADSVGLFQVESRAQMNFLPRMRPRCFYDLVIQVAIVRPGPIQGKMVHPYIRRRNGEEKPVYPEGALGDVLRRTLGVPLFQEQAMQIAIIGAGFSAGEADRLRRSLATFRKTGTIHQFRDRFIKGMIDNGHDRDFAGRCFSQIEGFGEYGFPESHAASFALLVYASAWLKLHHPGIYACALLNAQPMGFYSPYQIVQDTLRRNVEVRPVCINRSFHDNVMEPDGRGGLALRLGFRNVKSVPEDDAAWIASARGNGYREVADVWRRAGLRPAILRALAEADAFASIGIDRRQALWEALAIRDAAPLPLFERGNEDLEFIEQETRMPAMSLGEQLAADFSTVRLSLRAHPVALLRKRLTPDIDVRRQGIDHAEAAVASGNRQQPAGRRRSMEPGRTSASRLPRAGDGGTGRLAATAKTGAAQ